MKRIPCALTVTGRQKRPDGLDEQVFEVSGAWSALDDVIYLVYDEPEGAHVTLKFTPQRAVMLRSGAARMEFVPGRETTCAYATAAGVLPLEIRTTAIRCRFSEAGGSARLRYLLMQRGGVISENEVHIRARTVE